MLELLITAYEHSAPVQVKGGAARSLDAFRAMRTQIAKAKRDRSPERIIDALETMRRDDTETFRTVAVRLRQWLDEKALENDAPAIHRPGK